MCAIYSLEYGQHDGPGDSTRAARAPRMRRHGQRSSSSFRITHSRHTHHSRPMSHATIHSSIIFAPIFKPVLLTTALYSTLALSRADCMHTALISIQLYSVYILQRSAPSLRCFLFAWLHFYITHDAYNGTTRSFSTEAHGIDSNRDKTPPRTPASRLTHRESAAADRHP